MMVRMSGYECTKPGGTAGKNNILSQQTLGRDFFMHGFEESAHGDIDEVDVGCK